MVTVTPEMLQAIAHCREAIARQFAVPLTNAMRSFKISDSAARACQFLAEVADESAGFTRLTENLNYSEAAILRTFPTHFSRLEAATFEHQPERIANRAYAGRMGNRAEASGDGWKYRGRGLLQITGRDEYAACAEAFGAPLLDHPDWLEWPSWAARSAAWYWSERGLNALADEWKFDEISRRINGGRNGSVVRHEYLARAKSALGIK